MLPKEIFELSDHLKAQRPHKRILGWYYQKDWYYATGAVGCHCVIFPAHDAVGVRMLNNYTKKYKDDQIAFNRTLLNCLK